jgi:cell wall-associated NlpC family hydrolase
MAGPLATAGVLIRPLFTGFTTELQGGLQKSSSAASAAGEKHGKAYASGFGKSAARWIGATVGFTGAAMAATTVYQAMNNLAKQQALVANAVRATGGAAGVTAGQINTLASTISGYSGMSRVSVLEGAKLLLSFTSIRNAAGKNNDIYNRSLKAVADLAAATGRDMPSAARMLGKALQDPATGLTALRRAGVVFTAQQTEQIKKMQASGNLMGAQKLILDQLTARYGGAAKAAGSTFGGQMDKLKNLLIGFGIVAMQVIIPFLSKALSAFLRLPKGIQAVIVAVGLLGIALKLLSVSNPFTLIAMAVIALVMLIIKYRKPIADAFIWAWNKIKSTWDTVAGALHTAWSKTVNFFSSIWQKAVDAVRGAFRWLVLKLLGFFQNILDGAATMLGWVPGLGGKLRKAADAFRKFRDDVNAALGGVNGRTVHVGVAFADAQAGKGNPYFNRAAGGPVRGPGGPTDDRAGLFALSNKEWVIRAASASKYGYRAMDSVNRGTATIIPGMAAGGQVGQGVSVKPDLPSQSVINAQVNAAVLALAKKWAAAVGAAGSNAIVRDAMSWIGKIPYVWGGTAVPGGADCSGFVQAIYGRHGISAPRTSEAQGAWVRRTGPVPGGLAFYNSPAGGAPPGHVAIVGNRGMVISQGGGMGPQYVPLRSMPLMFTGVPPRGFDTGGWLPPGVSMAVNRTGQPERVLSPQQNTGLEARLDRMIILLERHPALIGAAVADGVNGIGRSTRQAMWRG